MRQSSGFTIVELLVVVTIIVLLLALLAPAMGKAVYRAQLLQCMTTHRLLATASQSYAFDNRRSYPDRDLPSTPIVYYGIQAHKLTHVYDTQSGTGAFDLRPVLRPYVSINKAFNDVFCEPVDYDKDDATGGSKETTHLYTSTFYWAGWRYTGPDGGPGMMKAGDRFTWGQERFSLIAGDIDTREQGNGYASHPDNQFLVHTAYQDYPFPFGGFVTSSGWSRSNGQYRDPLDNNFAYEDGSVAAFDKIVFSTPDANRDPRMTLISTGLEPGPAPVKV